MPKLIAPANGVTVRMYRHGHGDCFLLAIPREHSEDPAYVLIDCGYKPGSSSFVHDKSISDIVDHIGMSTGDNIDVAIITHEHQDHVNGIWTKKNAPFDRFNISEAWMAWTESPDDPLAQELRKRHRDAFVSLVAARQTLALAGALDTDELAVNRLDALLGLEIGSDEEALRATELLAVAADPERSPNKQGIKLIRDKATQNRGVKFLSPGDGPLTILDTSVRVFVLGPPRDVDLLHDEDPRGDEAFPDVIPQGLTFAAAATVAENAVPFNRRYAVSFGEALGVASPHHFFLHHYGTGTHDWHDEEDGIEVPSTAPWRRIDNEWLYSAETLALKLNAGINNTSLVLAFELPNSKKVLFFVGDAQRGNWISWNYVNWQDGETTITPRDLLARTVLYKVGHHGSHNATLDGTTDDEYPNLSWMATEPAAAREFTAMIPAVNQWALTKNSPPWYHPLPAIKSAVTEKAQGRVFQTDTDFPERPKSVSEGSWKAFTDRSRFDQLFFDYTIEDL